MRIVLALAIAVVADGLQFLFGLLPFVDQAIDVVGMILTSWVIGFHWLLLPTFVVKLVPFLRIAHLDGLCCSRYCLAQTGAKFVATAAYRRATSGSPEIDLKPRSRPDENSAGNRGVKAGGRRRKNEFAISCLLWMLRREAVGWGSGNPKA
jgi:hypothetical protein